MYVILLKYIEVNNIPYCFRQYKTRIFTWKHPSFSDKNSIQMQLGFSFKGYDQKNKLLCMVSLAIRLFFFNHVLCKYTAEKYLF